MSDSSARCTGPLFDGRAMAALDEGTGAARHEAARRGVQLTIAAFTASIRADHGGMQRSITTTDSSRTYSTRSGRTTYSLPVPVTDLSETVVTTDLATYGPWLEGASSRNETTRFPGYHGFRRAGQELDRIAGDVADGAIRPYVDRMN